MTNEQELRWHHYLLAGILLEEAESVIASPAPPPDEIRLLVPPTSEWRWFHPVDGVDPAASDPNFHTTFFVPEFDDSGWQVGTDSR